MRVKRELQSTPTKQKKETAPRKRRRQQQQKQQRKKMSRRLRQLEKDTVRYLRVNSSNSLHRDGAAVHLPLIQLNSNNKLEVILLLISNSVVVEVAHFSLRNAVRFLLPCRFHPEEDAITTRVPTAAVLEVTNSLDMRRAPTFPWRPVIRIPRVLVVEQEPGTHPCTHLSTAEALMDPSALLVVVLRLRGVHLRTDVLHTNSLHNNTPIIVHNSSSNNKATMAISVVRSVVPLIAASRAVRNLTSNKHPRDSIRPRC